MLGGSITPWLASSSSSAEEGQLTHPTLLLEGAGAPTLTEPLHLQPAIVQAHQPWKELRERNFSASLEEELTLVSTLDVQLHHNS